ncbi:hypothetical protein RRG08_013399 [Elysia crispata]|uniref:Uncharacterized protein n=1 Tax=Elysia crispata TaxID=231223 RepID=A0AAE1B6K1_9GAST|nr:hypothetical protein RRG08_013399 [Elysia crispata]
MGRVKGRFMGREKGRFMGRVKGRFMGREKGRFMGRVTLVQWYFIVLIFVSQDRQAGAVYVSRITKGSHIAVKWEQILSAQGNQMALNKGSQLNSDCNPSSGVTIQSRFETVGMYITRIDHRTL